MTSTPVKSFLNFFIVRIIDLVLELDIVLFFELLCFVTHQYLYTITIDSSVVKSLQIVNTPTTAHRRKLHRQLYLLLRLLPSFFLPLALSLVLASLALAVRTASHSRIIALTISFQTVRFTTITSFLRKLATPGSSFFYSLLSILDQLLEAWSVFAVDTTTILPALLTLRKALTVHFETESLFTGTAHLPLLARVSGSRKG